MKVDEVGLIFFIGELLFVDNIIFLSFFEKSLNNILFLLLLLFKLNKFIFFFF
jgi:hypothetical protein